MACSSPPCTHCGGCRRDVGKFVTTMFHTRGEPNAMRVLLCNAMLTNALIYADKRARTHTQQARESLKPAEWIFPSDCSQSSFVVVVVVAVNRVSNSWYKCCPLLITFGQKRIRGRRAAKRERENGKKCENPTTTNGEKVRALLAVYTPATATL